MIIFKIFVKDLLIDAMVNALKLLTRGIKMLPALTLLLIAVWLILWFISYGLYGGIPTNTYELFPKWK